MKKSLFTLIAIAILTALVYYFTNFYKATSKKQHNEIALFGENKEEDKKENKKDNKTDITKITNAKNSKVQPNEIPISKVKKRADKQEELIERTRQEFLMAVDPSIGYVPTGRLIEGEEKAKQIMSRMDMIRSSSVANLSWTERGPNNVGGRTRAFLFDQSDATGNTAFAGSVSGGLWRTTNFKTGTPITWTQIASISQNLAITCIAQDPVVPATLYAGTGEGFDNFDAVRGLGVYKSTDAGLNWTLIASTTTGGTNANDFSFVQDIVVYNNTTRDVYAACRSAILCNSGGLMRSSNGGTSWARVIGTYTSGACTNATDFRINDLEISPSGDIWATSATEATGVGKIWLSLAGATVGNAGTWVDKTPSGTWQRIELACSPTNSNRVYALMQGTGSSVGGIRRTDDKADVPATSWTSIDNGTLWCDQGASSSVDFSRNQAWYDLILSVNPTNDATVFAGGVDVMRTTNSGSLWTQLTQWNTGCTTLPYVHADVHNIVYLPGSSTEFVIATDGGLFYTADGGTTFSEKNTGYNVTQFYSGAINPNVGSNVMLAGAQDNGTQRFTTAGMNATATATGGDGGFCFIDQKNPLQQITNYTGTSLNISNNGGTSFTYPGSYATDRFINPADFDTATSTLPALSTTARYYCGGTAGNLRRVTVNFSTLTLVSNSLAVTGATASRSVSAVKVDPNTPDRVWVAMSTASSSFSVIPLLYYSSSSSATPVFTAITLPAAVTSGQYISSIDVENGNANHILITLSNYGIASVYESTDLGVTWISLDNNNVNLPDVPVRWGMFIPAGLSQGTTVAGGIMLATELGVWGAITVTGTSTAWAANNSIMGNVRTNMIKFRGSDNAVLIASHGRGLFTSNLTVISTIWNGFTWSNGAPTSTVDAIIASSTVPTESFTCKSLTINNTFALTTTGITANVNGNIINNGNGIAGTGGLTIAANSIISGNAINFNGALTVNTGAILTTAGLLTLTSTATNTGKINNSAGTITGNVTIERFIPAKAARRFSFITSPVSQALSAAWQQQIHITGAGTGGTPCPSLTAHSNGFDASTTNAPNLFSYNASAASGSRWTANTTGTTGFTLTPGTGYRLNVRGARSIGCNLLNGNAGGLVPTAVTLSATGAVNNASKNAGSFSNIYNNNLANNWVLIGNPYPSEIDFTAFRTTNSSVINASYIIYDPQNAPNNVTPANMYSTWNAGTWSNAATSISNANGQYIANGQAFFVQATAASNITLNFTEAHKYNGTQNGVFRTAQTWNDIVRIAFKKDADDIDQTVIRYSNEAGLSNNRLGDLDATLLSSSESYLGSIKAGSLTSIQTRSLQNVQSDSVALDFNVSETGNYNFNFSEHDKFTTANIYLLDKYTNTTTEVKANPVYNFSVDKANAATQTNRFVLVFNKAIVPVVTTITGIKMYPNPANKNLTIELPITEGKYTLRITDVIGKQVYQNQLAGGVQAINISKLAQGNYVVETTDSKGNRAVEKLVKQ